MSSWHIFWTNQWLKASHFLLLIRIWSIVSVKIMMMIAKAHVWACKIRLEPVWCPRFACGLVLTFSFAHRHSSTSLGKLFAALFVIRLQFPDIFNGKSGITSSASFDAYSTRIIQLISISVHGGTFWWWWYYHISKGRQGYKEMFSIRLVTNYFQWTMSTMWQIFSGTLNGPIVTDCCWYFQLHYTDIFCPAQILQSPHSVVDRYFPMCRHNV